MRKTAIHLCAVAAAIFLVFAPDAEAKRLGSSSSAKKTADHPDSSISTAPKMSVSASASGASSGSTAAATIGATAAVAAAGAAVARTPSPEEQKRLDERLAAKQAEEERLKKMAAERQLAENIKAEEEKARLEKQAAEEKSRQNKLELREQARLAEEQRIQEQKDRERQCVILPVMSDAQIAKCREVWR